MVLRLIVGYYDHHPRANLYSAKPIGQV